MNKKLIKHLNMYKSFGIEYCEPISFDKKVVCNNILPNTIEELHSYIEHCSLCELSKLNKKKSIGSGNINSDIYIVGVSCDFQNPNIGTIVKTIVEDLLSLNMDDIYITNLIKCTIQTHNNINNTNINLCKEYFIKQVDIIRPKYIIALGETFQHIVKNEKEVSYVYGNCYNYNNVNLIPMLDFEFVYKNPSYKDELYKDFKKLKILIGKK